MTIEESFSDELKSISRDLSFDISSTGDISIETSSSESYRDPFDSSDSYQSTSESRSSRSYGSCSSTYEPSPYEVLNFEELQLKMDEDIAEVKAKLSPCELSPTEIRLLLDECNWNELVLFEKITGDKSSMEKLYAKLNISLKKVVPVKREVSSCEELNFFYCAVCGLTCSSKSMVILDCNHVYCKDCVKTYINDGIQSQQKVMFCPSDSCNSLISLKIVEELLNDRKVVESYQRKTFDSYVLKNSTLSWCPGKNCNKAFKIEKYAASTVNVECTSCKRNFCFNCRRDVHEPLDCDMLTAWLNIQTSDELWIKAYVKYCPHCALPITKEDGYNQLTCIGCGHEFCWTCLNPWKSHDYDACNNPDKSERDESKQELDRHGFYQDEYDKQKKKTLFEKNIGGNIGNQVVKKAIEVLKNCRTYLMYTYVFTFFLKRNNMSAVLELNQKDLRDKLDDLSLKLERYDNTELGNHQVISALNENVSDCERRRKLLISSIDEGYEVDTWKFNL